MPRKYVKTVGPTSLFKYTPEVLSAAVTSVESGENSIREAARQFRVPYGTIFNRIKGLFTGKHGGPTVLNDCEERELCDVVQIAGQWGFPLTQSDMRFLVKSYLDTKVTEVDTKSTPSSNGPNCSFSEQLVNLMKQERYGESPSRNIPKRRRLMDIQPGESVSEQQAQEILAKKEVSLYDGYINPNESGHKKIRIKQEKDDDSNPMSSAKPKKGKQTKRAQKSQVRVKIPFRDENLNPDDNVPKKIKVKQEKDDSLILGTERKKFKTNQKKGKKGESLKSSVSNILISSEEQQKLNKQQEKLPARSCLKKRLTRIRN